MAVMCNYRPEIIITILFYGDGKIKKKNKIWNRGEPPLYIIQAFRASLKRAG